MKISFENRLLLSRLLIIIYCALMVLFGILVVHEFHHHVSFYAFIVCLILLGFGVSLSVRRLAKDAKMENDTSTAIIKAQEEERKMLGAELHDNIGQLLASTQLFLTMAAKAEKNDREKFLDDTRKYLLMAIDEVRNISHSVSPAFLEHISFTEAVEDLLNNMNPHGNFKVEFEYDKNIEEKKLSDDIKLNLYRILQEQLKNIHKYSKATVVRLSLGVTDHSFYFRITDNGVGFDIHKVKFGIGLLNMKKRAELFSGKVQIHSEPQKGCSVLVEIPIQPDQAA